MAEGGGNEGAESSSSPMANLGIRAVLVGATGAIGECLLGELVASKNFSSIVVLGRREAQVLSSYNVDQKAEQESGRLKQEVIDFEKISNDTVGEHFKNKDVFFCSLGSTRRAAGSAEAFRHIDYDYVVNCAQVAKDSGVPFMSYVSSSGANPNSRLFYYSQVKGQVEEALKGMKFQSTSIYKPGLLDRGEKTRMLEKVAGWFMKSISVATVAKAMRIEAEQYFSKKKQATEEDKEQQNLLFNAEIRALCEQT